MPDFAWQPPPCCADASSQHYLRTTLTRPALGCATTETIGTRAATIGGAAAGDDGDGAAAVATGDDDGAMTVADGAETRMMMTSPTEPRQRRATATIRVAAAATGAVAVVADGTLKTTMKTTGVHAALVRVGWEADPLAGVRTARGAARSPAPVAALSQTPFSAG